MRLRRVVGVSWRVVDREEVVLEKRNDPWLGTSLETWVGTC